MKDETIQAVAKAADNAVDAARDLGRYIARFVSGPLEAGASIVNNELICFRWERQLRLIRRCEDYMKELGMDGPTRPVAPKVAIPLFQGALLEEDDSLQDIWVRLLVNAADADRGVEVRRSFVSILQDFGVLEARIMATVYSHKKVFPDPENLSRRMVFGTVDLPESILVGGPRNPQQRLQPDVEVALVNLVRLGCLAPSSAGGLVNYHSMIGTPLGKALMDACTLRQPQP